MKLDELLKGDELTISEWLSKKGLLHECGCGYTVYDPDAVNDVVQRRFGDKRSDEIFSWVCNLSNFGWMDLESSEPKYDIYHCQYCENSEFTLMMDIMRKAEFAERQDPKPKKKPTSSRVSREKYMVYIDESYTNEFPRKPGGSLAFAAFIVSKKDAGKLQGGVAQIIDGAYRGQKPKEIKYAKLVKYPRLLKEVGEGVAKLICSLPSSAVILIYVPSEGLIQEAVRVVRALAYYEKKPPTPTELSEASSTEKVEEAVRAAPTRLAQTIAGAVGSYLGSRNLSGEIWFDPRSKKLDEELHNELALWLPKMPINVPLMQHAGAIVGPWPSRKMKRLGRRVTAKSATASHQSAGLQIADFLAGDIRRFIADVPEILIDGTVDEPLVNTRVLFPEHFRPSPLSESTKEKISGYRGLSLFPHYRKKLVHDFISCYAMNGQMRNVDLAEGMAYDIMD